MFNFVQMIGRVGQTPEIKKLQTGDKASFSLAVNETYKKNGEKMERTHWFKCEAWGHTAGYIQQYVHKGDKIAIAGRLEQQTWEQDGEKKTRIVIRVESITSLASSRGNGEDATPPEEAPPPTKVASPDNYAAYEVPF